MQDCVIRWRYLSYALMQRFEQAWVKNRDALMQFSAREQGIVAFTAMMYLLEYGGFATFFTVWREDQLPMVFRTLDELKTEKLSALVYCGYALLAPVLAQCKQCNGEELYEHLSAASRDELEKLNVQFQQVKEQAYFCAYQYYAG